jgi:hypothetical protein
MISCHGVMMSWCHDVISYCSIVGSRLGLTARCCVWWAGLWQIILHLKCGASHVV